jgi:hypothetical protein
MSGPVTLKAQVASFYLDDCQEPCDLSLAGGRVVPGASYVPCGIRPIQEI